ncbi:MAG: hypothetical protein AB9866_11015 [Syntrophobacteraceae bacterium]
MITDSRKIRITFTERLLGTAPPREAYEKYILTKAPVPDDEETMAELDTVETVVGGDKNESMTTRFHRDVDGIYLLDYQIKGFLKEAANVLKENLPNANPKRKRMAEAKKNRHENEAVPELTPARDAGTGIQAAKSKIDNFIFVFPRYIYLKAKADGTFARPLRAQTAQGPRVSIVCSEFVEAGCEIDITIDILPGCEIGWPAIEEMLNYGAYKGIGQFRNGSFGRFSWEYLEAAKPAAGKIAAA